MITATRPAAYLDHASTTPMSSASLDAYMREARRVGNASSLHAAGRAARRVVEESRESIAESLGARPHEVIFTSGGTEADNLAVKGIFWGRRAQNTARTRLLIGATEHHAVLDPAFWLAEHAGAEIVLLPVDSQGVIDLDAVAEELQAKGSTTALLSAMWANNEVGTLAPLAQITRLAHKHGVPVHTDAVQAVGQLPVNFAQSAVDAMTISGHKIGGPVGVGALLARRDLAMEAVQHGGGQERGVRSGTLDVPAIAALAVAVREATSAVQVRAAHMAALRDALVEGVLSAIPDAQLSGPPVQTPASPASAGADPAASAEVSADTYGGRLPGNAHFTFPGTEGDSLMYLLDSAGVEVSTGSACQAGVPQPSHVLLAMGFSEADARGALRFSFGATSTMDDVSRALSALPDVVARARVAGHFTGARSAAAGGGRSGAGAAGIGATNMSGGSIGPASISGGSISATSIGEAGAGTNEAVTQEESA